MEKWYLIYHKYGELLRAIEHLERQGVTCLAPRYEEIKVVRGRKKKVMEPLFPNYIFVKFDYEIIHTSTIKSTRGVSHFVRYSNLPVIVPDEIIASLMVPNFMKEVTEQLPEKGQAVVMHGGIYEGIQAIYSEPNGDKRSVLLLNILNREVPKVVDNDRFTPVKANA